MECPRCHQANPPHARFCLGCGAPLAFACGSCGANLPAGARFCLQCGQAAAPVPSSRPIPTSIPKHLSDKIINSRAALEGERKHVTVLFADLKGSMELLADRDPEEAQTLLDPVLEHMMEAVHRFEGTVNQVMGDGIMALFGAPIAHEDHAVRACYAALRMQESVNRYAEGVRRQHGVRIRIRVGINSGEVVVRAIGSDLRMDYTAVGQTTHLAARMEQLADPGTILITADTLTLVEGFVEVKALGPVPVKGVAEPVEIYEATGGAIVRTRLHATARRGLTRFVGRDAEIDHLRRVQQLAAGGRGQVAAMVGEAGVGKSRLVYEFTHSHRLEGWLIAESVSVSYGKATSYLPVIALLKGYFKIEERDDLRAIREKVTGKLVALDEALKPTLPALLSLLDVPVDEESWRALPPSGRRQQTLDAVKRLLLRESREQPLLVIFEDLHWIDGETQALLDGLVDSLASARLLLLVNYRPEYQHAWGSKTHYSQLRLDALPAESTAELLDALLGEDPALVALKHALVRRGNPFFLEETVRTLAETKVLSGERGRYRLMQPVQTIQVPATVQVILAARIDRLDPEDKRLLQVASVIGKDVPLTLLQCIADLPDYALRAGLDRLQAAEFLYETGLYPDVEHTFKHALTHEVTYGGLLNERRRTLHARVVEAMETLYRDRLGEHIERLAHHASRGEMGQKAVEYLWQAGLRAASRSALRDARGWFDEAARSMETEPESQRTLEQAFDVRVDLRSVLTPLGEVRRSLERVQEAEILAERLNDDRRRGLVYALKTNSLALLGEQDDAIVSGERALDIASRLGDLRLRILTTTYLAQLHLTRGEYERAVALATRNLAALPEDWVHEYRWSLVPTGIQDRSFLVRGLIELGRFDDAAKVAAEALRLAGPAEHPLTVGTAQSAAGALHLARGEWTNARAWLDRVITVRENAALIVPFAYARSAWAIAELDESEEAIVRVREAERLLERRAASGIGRVTDGYYVLGRACLRLDRIDDARRFADRALASLSPGAANAYVRHLGGEIAAHAKPVDREAAEVEYEQTLALATPLGMRPLVAHSHLGLGRLYLRTGRLTEARQHLTVATTMYREMGMKFWLAAAEAHISGLH